MTCGTEHELAHVGVWFFDNGAHERYYFFSRIKKEYIITLNV